MSSLCFRCNFVRIAAGVIAAVMLGCSESKVTVPRPDPFVLSFSTGVTATGRRTLINGQSVHLCDFPIVVTARGGNRGDYASWLGGNLDFRLAANGQMSQSYVSFQDLTQWFGSDRVVTGNSVTASRSFYWSGPFMVIVSLQYMLADGEQRSGTVTLVCN